MNARRYSIEIKDLETGTVRPSSNGRQTTDGWRSFGLLPTHERALQVLASENGHIGNRIFI
jgi:hypothetical protein